MNIGLTIILSLPNGISIYTEIDQSFGAYKGWCKTRTVNHFGDKLLDKIKSIEDNNLKLNTMKDIVNVNEMKVVNKELDMVRKNPERGYQDSDTTPQFLKVTYVVGLTNSDLFIMINSKKDDKSSLLY